jgi:hypothetical protein
MSGEVFFVFLGVFKGMIRVESYWMIFGGVGNALALAP